MSPRPLDRWGFTIVLGLFLLAIAAIVAWTAWRNRDDTLDLTGQVVISRSANIETRGNACQGAGQLAALAPGVSLTITPRDGEPVTATLDPGAPTASGECAITFSASVPEAIAYEFAVDGLPILRHDRYLIDIRTGNGEIALRVILRWD